MGGLRAQAQFEGARWRLRLLLPLWVLQLGLTLTMAGLFAWRVGDSMQHYRQRDEAGEIPTLELVWEVTNVALSSLASICTMFEIARYLAESLTPWTVLFTHIIKLTCAACLMALDVVAHIKAIDGHYSTIGLALDAAFLITAAALTVYAALTYRRLTQQNYAHGYDIRGYGFNDGLDPESNKAGLRGVMEKRISYASSRLSFSSQRGKPSFEAVPLQSVERTPALYSHERDTQFEDFVRKRSSSTGSAMGVDADRVMANDFGLTVPRDGSPKDEEVKIGVVKSRPRGMSQRDASWTSDHVLVSVPEEEDHEGAGPGSRRNHDKEALLGTARDSTEELHDSTRAKQDEIVEPKWARQ